MNEVLIYALVLLITKIVSEIFFRIKIPSVIGIILAGIICGPVFHIFQPNEVLEFFSEIGILFLLFIAGLDTNIEYMKKQGKSSIMAAITGIFVPLIMSFSFLLLNIPLKSTYFLGLILTATSVSITVMVLFEIKKLNTRSGITILASAVIDDIISIVLLTFSLIFLLHTGNVFITFIKLFLYGLFLFIYYKFLSKPIMFITARFKSSESIITLSIILMVVFSFLSHKMGVAAITGAYFIGLAIAKTNYRVRIIEKVSLITNTLFVSIFFFVVGLKTTVNLNDINFPFLFLFIFVAIAGKIIGPYFACYFTGMTKSESLKIGFGMVARGEVALVIASIGLLNGLINQSLYNAVIIMIIVTSIIVPFALKYLYRTKIN